VRLSHKDVPNRSKSREYISRGSFGGLQRLCLEFAGLGIFVKLEKENFIGKEAIAKQKAEGLKRKIVGIELKDKAIPRHGYDVEVDGKVIGQVTTGYNSISTGKSVCMALIDAEYGKLGTEVEVRIRKKVFPGVVTKKRFYEKNYKK